MGIASDTQTAAVHLLQGELDFIPTNSSQTVTLKAGVSVTVGVGGITGIQPLSKSEWDSVSAELPAEFTP